MLSFEPAVQPTSVGVAGIIVTVPMPAWAFAAIDRIQVVKTAGDCETFDVRVSAEPTCAIEREVMCEDESDGTVFDRQDDWTWKPTEGQVGLYVRIIPNKGSNNAFHVRLTAYQDE